MSTTFMWRLAGLIALAVVALSSVEAKAAIVTQNFTCNQGIADIVWDGGGLYIDCAGQPNRMAAFNFNICPGYTGNIDNIKIWQALATTAHLSGRSLMITFATPASCAGGSTGAIVSMQLN